MFVSVSVSWRSTREARSAGASPNASALIALTPSEFRLLYPDTAIRGFHDFVAGPFELTRLGRRGAEFVRRGAYEASRIPPMTTRSQLAGGLATSARLDGVGTRIGRWPCR